MSNEQNGDMDILWHFVWAYAIVFSLAFSLDDILLGGLLVRAVTLYDAPIISLLCCSELFSEFEEGLQWLKPYTVCEFILVFSLYQADQKKQF